MEKLRVQVTTTDTLKNLGEVVSLVYVFTGLPNLLWN